MDQTPQNGRPLRAWRVDSPEGQSVVVFDTVAVRARRRGACDLDLEFEEVESCQRVPAFDVYAPGPVPAVALLQEGWWLECTHSGEMLTIDDEPWCVGTRAYRSRWAWLEDRAERAARVGRERMVRNVVAQQFPHARVKRVVTGIGRRRGLGAMLTCDGMQGCADWLLGDQTVSLQDRDAFLWIAARDYARPALPAA